jgi:hypothetical protein
MVVGAEPQCFGMRLENGRFLDSTYCRKSIDKFIGWDRTCRLCRQGRRDMSTVGEENWVLKLETTYTSRCHLWEGYDVWRYEASSHLGSMVHSRSRRGEKKNWKQNFRISFSIHPNLEGEIHFKGVGLSHRKISNFGMWLKFTKF